MKMSDKDVVRATFKNPLARLAFNRVLISVASVAGTFMTMNYPEVYANFCQVM